MAYNLQVRLNGERDADIIAWLNAQDSKSDAVRDALRQAIAPSRPHSDMPALDLGAIRQVVEAALDERLAGLALASGSTRQDTDEPAGENAELAARLDDMMF